MKYFIDNGYTILDRNSYKLQLIYKTKDQNINIIEDKYKNINFDYLSMFLHLYVRILYTPQGISTSLNDTIKSKLFNKNDFKIAKLKIKQKENKIHYKIWYLNKSINKHQYWCLLIKYHFLGMLKTLLQEIKSINILNITVGIIIYLIIVLLISLG